MNNDERSPPSEGELRRRAEAIRRWSSGASREHNAALSIEETRAALHELQVHQIELDLQNQELQRAYSELETTRARYFDLYDSAPVGYLSVSEGGVILQSNLTACTLLGWPRGGLVELPITRFILAADQDVFYLHRRRGLATEEAQSCEIRMVRSDGSTLWTQLALTLAKTSDGAPQFRLVIVDVSARKLVEGALVESEERLRQSQKMEAIGQLAGGVAHDFNNMLSVILSYTQLAIDGLHEGDGLKKDLTEVFLAAKRAEGLTRQLLVFSRRQMLRPEPLDLADTIRALASMLRKLIGEDVTLHLVLPDGLFRVVADRGQLEQVVMNLVVNSRDAMPDGGRISIALENRVLDDAHAARAGVAPGPFLVLTVADTGAGMTAEVRARIFEPFFTTKGQGKGTGLGLSMVYGIVRQCGGAISVESILGHGTSFEIVLPKLEAPADLPDAVPNVVRLPRGGDTVLVVEDEPALSNVIKRVLTVAGYVVHVAANGAEALAICERLSLDHLLVLTDVIMPGMNGRELARRIEQITPHARFIFMSGYTAEVLDRHGINELNFLAKPFDLQTLVRKVTEVLERP